ncbi:MAG: alpha-N-acetylglucosaminidase [Defluviitaleaceae bacterium]|nr:alpha-N-acetylglucosaminidase [Defluviitaleaceae bacterium]
MSGLILHNKGWESPPIEPWPDAQNDHRRHADFHLDGLYNVTRIVIITPVRPGVHFHYQVYASHNVKDFSKIAYKADNSVSTPEGITYNVSAKARVIRVQVSFASDSMQVGLSEVKIYGEKTNEESGLFQSSKPTFLPDSDIVTRVLGSKWKSSFQFEEIQASSEQYELECIGDKIVIRGTTPVAQVSGFNAYLKEYCHVNYNPLFESNLNMPPTLPLFEGKITRQTNYTYRYALNFCTFSYTMAFWGWPEYEKFLDWAAMNGINLMLQIVGQEEVLHQFLSQYGYSTQDVLDYICGPGYFAWFYMQNLTSWGGPLPESWLSHQAELGRKINARMKTLGITPVLQGFSGMVPVDLQKRMGWPQYDNPTDPRNAIAPQGQWIGFKRPDMIRTTSTSGNFFEEAAKHFYNAQRNVFGDVSNFYAVDPFHEGGNIQGMERSQVYNKVQKAMIDADPDAIWLLQQWGGNITTETLQLMDQDHTLVLDLNSEMRDCSQPMEDTGTPWIWCMLHNFGGRMGIFGDIPVITEDIPKAFTKKNNMVGIGSTMEAYSNSGIMYDLLADMTWQNDEANLLEKYVHSRYSELEPNALAGWSIIANSALSRKTVYVQGPPESIINARPSDNFVSASTWGHCTYQYDPTQLEEALQYFIKAYDRLKNCQPFIYDFVELTAQVLSTSALTFYKKDKDKFLDAIRLMDDVLAVSPRFGVGHWLHAARNVQPDMDDWTKDLFEFNARTLITTWGGKKNIELTDYSNRQWSGLTKDLYLPRWERFIKESSTQDAWASSSQSERPAQQDFFLMEWEWANRKSDEGNSYPITGSGANLAKLAMHILNEFPLDTSAIKDRNNIALGKPTIVDGSIISTLTNGDLSTTWKPETWPVVLSVPLYGPSGIKSVAFTLEQFGSYAICYKIEALLNGVVQKELLISNDAGYGWTGTVEHPLPTTANEVRFTFDKCPDEGIFAELMIFI